jgi:hypothetical protein
MAAWAFAVFWLGWWTARHRPADLFFIYLLGLVGLSSAMEDQYLAIPLAACAVFYQCWPAWLYTLMATLNLAFSPSNLGPALDPLFHSTIFSARIPMYPQAQLWLIILVIILFLRPSSDARSLCVSPPEPAAGPESAGTKGNGS